MQTVKELYDIALASFINQRGGMDAFRDFLEAKCRFGELTERQKSDILETARGAVERYGDVDEQTTATKPSQAAILTAAQVAEMTGISKWTIYHLARRGRIPHHRPEVGKVLFDREEVTGWRRGYTTTVKQSH